MSDSVSFTPSLFRFLKDLAANNERDWFHANEARFERDVKAPALAFIGGFGRRLAKISPHFEADPRPVGGSLFRIHRDVRFAKDKAPYKTFVGIQFRHSAGKDAHAPGFYLHLQPGNVFAGAGIWHPPTPTLGIIRDAIAADPRGFARVTAGKDFKALGLALEGESLARPPRGYDPEHPALEDLKRKDFIAVAHFDAKAATSEGFDARVAEVFKAGGPLVRFVCAALGQPY